MRENNKELTKDEEIRLMSNELQDLNDIVSKQVNLINNKMEEVDKLNEKLNYYTKLNGLRKDHIKLYDKLIVKNQLIDLIKDSEEGEKEVSKYLIEMQKVAHKMYLINQEIEELEKEGV